MTIYEQILAGLQTKFQGADAATLNRIATKKAEGITDESQVKTIIDGVSFSDVLQSYGDARVNDANKTFKENYEKKYGIKDDKPVEGKKNEDPPTPAPDKPADIAKLISEEVAKGISSALKPVTDELSTLKNEKSASEFSDRVSEAAKKYGINDNLVKMLNVPKDADLDKFMQETKQTFVDAGLKEVVPPQSAEQLEKTETESFAKAINDDTQKKVEQQKK